LPIFYIPFNIRANEKYLPHNEHINNMMCALVFEVQAGHVFLY